MQVEYDGAWYKATVQQVSSEKVSVQYDEDTTVDEIAAADVGQRLRAMAQPTAAKKTFPDTPEGQLKALRHRTRAARDSRVQVRKSTGALKGGGARGVAGRRRCVGRSH